MCTITVLRTLSTSERVAVEAKTSLPYATILSEAAESEAFRKLVCLHVITDRADHTWIWALVISALIFAVLLGFAAGYVIRGVAIGKVSLKLTERGIATAMAHVEGLLTFVQALTSDLGSLPANSISGFANLLIQLIRASFTFVNSMTTYKPFDVLPPAVASENPQTDTPPVAPTAPAAVEDVV